jgi:hypothetical protein
MIDKGLEPLACWYLTADCYTFAGIRAASDTSIILANNHYYDGDLFQYRMIAS